MKNGLYGSRKRLPPPKLIPVPAAKPEDVVVDTDGSLITGTEDGQIFRLDPVTGKAVRIARTGGRPLGIEFLPDRKLLICDSKRGLLAADPATGKVEVLLDRVGGRQMRFCNNAAVASDGTVYFSDSSLRYGIDHYRRDVIENRPSGRLLRFTPAKTVDVLIENIPFANGVALAPDESFAVVAETAGYCLTRYWLKGPQTGRSDTFAADLPGMPDNLSTGSDGLLWVALASPRDRRLESILKLPYPLRKLLSRIPESVGPAVARSVLMMAFDFSGRCVHNLEGDAGSFHMVTGVREYQGTIYAGSIVESAIAAFRFA
ncbi:MAG: SMP-30/gluconolactonase/LRE family protein [Deltaproteobacteria bacterium]|nr:SMP-30/gluconolactonase/LRE family protein [Deltaproteobacteria bacterium]